MAVNFSKNQEEITKAWKGVADTKSAQNWALFGYEGTTNNIKLMSTGTDGLAGLVGGLNCSLIQYGFCRVIESDLGINKLVLINWQGDSSPLSRKGLCASHVADVTNYFKGCTQTITIRNDDEATVDYLMEQITKSSATSRINLSKHFSSQSGDTSKVGSSYSKTDINSEIPSDRKSFWQRQEEEEKERLAEEKKRAAEKQAQFERERKTREELEAKKLAEAIKERDRLIDATRQAERRESSASQTSAPSSGTTRNDDDERVGRRSELLRLERNQETQSLIEKGLIKNKRAIFEQASQQQQSSTNPMPRKSSGTMVAQRLNSFKSLESSSSNNPPSIEKLSNGFSKQVSLTNTNESAPKSIVSEKVETIQITNDQQISTPTTTAPPQPETIPVKSSSPVKEAATKEEPRKEESTEEESTKVDPIVANGQVITNGSSDTNGNNIHDTTNGTTKAEPGISVDDIIYSGKIGIKARAMYDYEAADDTEISFDPDDIIGFIDKVDSGWWHGSVVTGRFKGRSGLFPANHVAEIL